MDSWWLTGASLIWSVLRIQATTNTWTCPEVPDPQQQPAACGMAEPTWLCDPDHVLNHTDYSNVVRMIQQIQTMNRCVCEDCGTNTTFPNTYIKVAIAVIPEIQVAGGSRQEALAEFAECVRTTRWQHAGWCQDDVVIVMETNTLTVAYSCGTGAVGQGLSEQCMDVIIASNMDSAAQGYIQGLYAIVEAIKNSLRGVDYCVEFRNTVTASSTPATSTASPGGLSVITWIVIGSVISAAVLL